MKSIQPWKQSQNLGICHQSSLLALCLQQTVSSSTIKYCQDTYATTDPLTVYYHYTAWTIHVDFCPRNTYHSSAQATGSWICGRGTADTEDFWLHGGSALLISVLFKGQVQLQIILKVSLNCKIQWVLLNSMKLTANKNRGKLHCKL